jgi:hypothetical protein
MISLGFLPENGRARFPYKGGSDFLRITEAAALSVGVNVSAAVASEY